MMLLACVCTLAASAQVSQRYFGRSGRSEIIVEHARLNNGNIVAAGFAWTNTNMGTSDAFIMCLDPADNIIWAKEISTPRLDRFVGVTATSDGGCVAIGVAGESPTNLYDGNHAIIYKFDAAGNIIWNRILNNTTPGEILLGVAEVPGSGHIVCCGSYNYSPGLNIGFVVNLDNAGNTLWIKNYSNIGTNSCEFRAITYMNGKLIITGIYSGNTYFDGILMTINESNGNVVWGRSFDYTTTFAGGNSCQWPSDIQVVNDRIYVGTYLAQNNTTVGTVKPTLVSFDTTGQNPICLEYPITGYDYASAIRSRVVSPTEIYLAQNIGSTSWNPQLGTNTTGMGDVACTKIKSMTAAGSNWIYTRRLSPPGEQMFQSIEIRNGQILGFGSAKNDPSLIGGQDVFKLEADTSFPVTPSNCVVNVTGQQFGNPIVSLNTNFTFTVTTPTFPSPSLTPTVTAVNITSVNPCPSADTTIINSYAAVLARDTCDNALTVDTATGFRAGDTVLIIQMKGARIDSTNTSAFGTVTDYRQAGNYEFNVIRSVSGNNLSLMYELLHPYDIPDGKVQVVRVACFQNYTVSKPHTCLPWNGSKGGVFAIRAAGTLTLSENIDVSGKGFRGGARSANYFSGCSSMDYYYPAGSNFGGGKGEGIAAITTAYAAGRGAPANGGGGGNHVNAGGAGGGNYGAGGRGGNQWDGCPGIPIGGDGGWNMVYNNTQNRVFLGGGGGGGHQNDNVGTSGEHGGGIIFIQARTLSGGNRAIRANGNDNNVAAANDGGGGGGGGGCVLLSAGAVSGTGSIEAKGGKGSAINYSGCHGPGGGGGGGAIWTSMAIPGAWTTNVTGGAAGIPLCGGNYGAGAGATGSSISGLVMPQATTAFVSVADPHPVANSPVCVGDTIRLTSAGSYPGTVVYGWTGPAGFSGSQRDQVIPNAAASRAGVYTLTVTYAGCTISDTVRVIVVEKPVVNLGSDTGICASAVPLQLRAPQPAGSHYLWSNGLSDTQMLADRTGSYWLQVTDAYGCVGSDTINVTVIPDPLVFIGTDTIICEQMPLRIGMEIPGASHTWNTGSTDPYITVSATGTYILTVNLEGCRAYDTMSVTAMPPPAVDIGGDRIICPEQVLTLAAGYTGNGAYLWSTGDTTGSIDVAAPGRYWVTVTSEYRCVGSDTVSLTLQPLPTVALGTDTTVCEGGIIPLLLTATQTYADSLVWTGGHSGNALQIASPGTYIVTGVNQCGAASDTILISGIFCDIWLPNTFTPNGDGINDIFRVLGSTGRIQEVTFSVFSRWGQEIFRTTDPAKGWDGTFSGTPQPLGTYVYMLRYTLAGKRYLQKGNFHLLR